MSSVGTVNDIAAIRKCYKEHTIHSGDLEYIPDEVLVFQEKYNLSDTEVLDIVSGKLSIVDSLNLILSK